MAEERSFRVAIERQFGERFFVSGGYMHQNNPVPSSTLSPLTAAIMGNGLATGIGCKRGRARFDLSYQLNITASERVKASGLLSGEFDNSRVSVGSQALTLSTSFHL